MANLRPSISPVRKVTETKFGLVFTLTKLLLVGMSHQQLVWNFTAPNFSPVDTNPQNAGSGFQTTTNLISWDNGVTYSPLFTILQQGSAIAFWNQDNKFLGSQAISGGGTGHMVDPKGHKMLIDIIGSDTGPSIHTLTYISATTRVALAKTVVYNFGSYQYFVCPPFQSIDNSNLYYFAYYSSFSLMPNFNIVCVDSNGSGTSYYRSTIYSADASEKKFLFLPTTGGQTSVLLLSFAYAGTSQNNFDASYLSKPDLTLLVNAKTKLNSPGGALVLPSQNFAMLDNLNETNCYVIDHYSNNIMLFPGMFSASGATLTQGMKTTVPFAVIRNQQYLAVLNMDTFAMLVGVAIDATVGYSASIYSKADLSLLIGRLLLQNDANSPSPSYGMSFNNALVPNGPNVVMYFATPASKNGAPFQYAIANITFKMCSSGKFLSLQDSTCYVTGNFPAKLGNSTAPGSLNLTIDSCSDANCLSCTSQNTACTQCDTGYQVNVATKGCSLVCSSNCDTCTSSTACTACSSGYTLNGGSCTATSSSNNTSNNSTINNSSINSTTNNSSSNNTSAAAGNNSSANNNATPTRNSKALAVGLGFGIGLGFGVPIVAGGIALLLTKLGVFKLGAKAAVGSTS